MTQLNIENIEDETTRENFELIEKSLNDGLVLYPLRAILGMDGYWKIYHKFDGVPSFVEIIHTVGDGDASVVSIEKDYVLVSVRNTNNQNLVVNLLIGNLPASQEATIEKYPSV